MSIIDSTPLVIGERIVTPAAIVQLVFKVRLATPATRRSPAPESDNTDVDETKRSIKARDEREQTFLASKKDAEDLATGNTESNLAHAPYWPQVSFTHISSLL